MYPRQHPSEENIHSPHLTLSHHHRHSGVRHGIFGLSATVWCTMGACESKTQKVEFFFCVYPVGCSGGAAPGAFQLLEPRAGIIRRYPSKHPSLSSSADELVGGMVVRPVSSLLVKYARVSAVSWPCPPPQEY